MTKAEQILSKYDSYFIAENTEKERVVISYESALEAVNKALRIHDVVGQSEHLADDKSYKPCDGCNTSCKEWEIFFCKKLG